MDSAGPTCEEGAGLARFRITHERGPMTRQVRAAALEWGGEPAWEALLASVSPACRARFQKSIGFYEWVESPLALELHEAWARQRGLDDMTQRGEDAARQILGGVQRWILRLASPALLIQNIPRVFDYYYRGGIMSLTHLEPGRAEFQFRAVGYVDSWYREGLPAWMKVALELAGAREITVAHFPPEPTTEPHLHHYEITWRT